MKLHAVAEGREALPRTLDSRRVAVDAHDPPIGGRRFENGRGVPAEPEGHVGVQASGARRDQLDHALTKHGDMKCGGHAGGYSTHAAGSAVNFTAGYATGGTAPGAAPGRA